MSRFSLDTMIAEVNEEVRKREGVYFRLVNAGKMRDSVASMKIDIMKDVAEKLRELQERERGATAI